MILLALETATEACSVALWIDGDVRERFEVVPRRHAELALPWAEALLADAGIARSRIDAIAVGRGPGAFTGVRLGVAIAQGIALALDRPVLPVSTLAVLAMRAHGAGRDARAGAGDGDGDAGLQVLAAIDARMGEVYAAPFRLHGDVATPLAAERVMAPDAVELVDAGQAVANGDAGWIGVGTGFAAGEGLLARRLAPRLVHVDAAALPRASDVARLAAPALARGDGVAAERLEPAYLRDQVALTLAEQKAKREGG